MLCFNFFFLPPVGTFTIADPQNWVALAAFLVVSIVASNLSASARARATEALERRREVSRLFDLTRDILLTTEQEGALHAVARHVARRFNQDTVAICLPRPSGAWDIHHGGEAMPEIPPDDLSEAYARARGTLEFDARTRAYAGHRQVEAAGRRPLMMAPIRLGTRAIGLLILARTMRSPGSWRSRSSGINSLPSGARPNWRGSGQSCRRRSWRR
jgi:two-component system sensor histidine kinase KdpD